eukprot:3934097-Rhodomonas_salina.1
MAHRRAERCAIYPSPIASNGARMPRSALVDTQASVSVSDLAAGAIRQEYITKCYNDWQCQGRCLLPLFPSPTVSLTHKTLDPVRCQNQTQKAHEHLQSVFENSHGQQRAGAGSNTIVMDSEIKCKKKSHKHSAKRNCRKVSPRRNGKMNLKGSDAQAWGDRRAHGQHAPDPRDFDPAAAVRDPAMEKMGSVPKSSTIT